MKLFLDFETRSDIDLTKVGAHIYARQPSTEVLLIGYAIDDQPVKVIDLTEENFRDKPEFLQLVHAVRTCEYIYAWNAQFERLMYDQPLRKKCPELHPLTVETWYCVKAQATNANLPPSLDDCSYLLGQQGLTGKKIKGMKHIRMFSIPDNEGQFSNRFVKPEEWGEFIEYCRQDVEVTRQIHETVKDLGKRLLAEYHTSEYINDVGIRIDREFCLGASRLTNELDEESQRDLLSATEGECDKLRSVRTTKWIYDRLPAHLQEYMNDPATKTGYSLRAPTQKELLAQPDLPDEPRRALTVMSNGGGNAVKKFNTFYNRSDPVTNTAQGGYIFAGTHTGRFTSYGIQLQNLPREQITFYDPKWFEDFYQAVKCGAYKEAKRVCEQDLSDFASNIKGLVRYAIIARTGKKFVCVDWEQIEGRMAPWLAMGIDQVTDLSAKDKLDAYADPNRDVYCETASKLTGRLIGKKDPERQSYGKTSELALGYGGGVGALSTMAKMFNVELPNQEEIVRQWRKDNHWATRWHSEVMKAAMRAVTNPGVPFVVGRVTFMYVEQYLGGSLLCKLPSGRLQTYPFCKIQEEHGQQYISALRSRVRPKIGERGWPAIRLWHGILCENITQAAAGCLLRETLRTLSKRGYWIVGHTHDEILIEVSEHDTTSLANIEEIMTTPTQWRSDLPLGVDSWEAKRFRK